MGTLLYVNVGLENSPYRGFCGPNLLVEVRRIVCSKSQFFSNVGHYHLLSHTVFAGGRHISKGRLQHFGNHERFTIDCSHKHRMRGTASSIKSKTSHDVASSAWHLEWTWWASGMIKKSWPNIVHLELTVAFVFRSFQIEIELDTEHRYHSIFACPILRQQSSEENPPMKLVCGHVISRDALDKLCNGPT